MPPSTLSQVITGLRMVRPAASTAQEAASKARAPHSEMKDENICWR
jgi:hypothetical protein